MYFFYLRRQLQRWDFSYANAYGWNVHFYCLQFCLQTESSIPYCEKLIDLKINLGWDKCKYLSYHCAGQGNLGFCLMSSWRQSGLTETLLKPNTPRGKGNSTDRITGSQKCLQETCLSWVFKWHFQTVLIHLSVKKCNAVIVESRSCRYFSYWWYPLMTYLANESWVTATRRLTRYGSDCVQTASPFIPDVVTESHESHSHLM